MKVVFFWQKCKYTRILSFSQIFNSNVVISPAVNIHPSLILGDSVYVNPRLTSKLLVLVVPDEKPISCNRDMGCARVSHNNHSILYSIF